MYVRLQQYHPIPFALCPGVIGVLEWVWKVILQFGADCQGTIANSLSLIPVTYIFCIDEKIIPTKVLIQCLTIMRRVIKNFAYTVDSASMFHLASSPCQFAKDL
jgi:hypothetical protein